MVKNLIIKLIELFYLPVFRRYVPLHTFRYAFCGGANVVFDILLYFFVFHFITDKHWLDLGFVLVSPQIFALMITFPITLLSGLWLSKNISFQNSILSDKAQTLRYTLVVILNIGIKYGGLKFLTEVFYIYPSIANAIVTIVTIALSYFLQTKFTFKGYSK